VIVSAFLQVDLASVTDTAIVAPRTVVAIPPSSLDSGSRMRVALGGTVVYRDFDPGAPIVVGPPVFLATEAGEILATEAGEALILEAP
jgi:hypothetical protein